MSDTECSPSRQLIPPTSLYGMKRRVGPDAVLVEAATDPPAERDEIAEVHEHHRFAEGLTMHEEQLEHHEDAGRDAKAEGERRNSGGGGLGQMSSAPPLPPQEAE